MEWNRRKGARDRERSAAATFDAFDPEYTMTKGSVMNLLGWNWKHLKQAEIHHDFPKPKRFHARDVRYHPQHINDWLAARNGDRKVESWKP